MPAENETATETTEATPERFGAFGAVSRAVAWIGASAAALTLCCTVFGYLAKQVTLERLGVSTSVFEATSSETVATGAKFLASLVPLAIFGAFEFFALCWWTALALALFALALRRWRWRAEIRLLGIAAIYAAWLVVMLLRLVDRPAGDAKGLDTFAFVTLAAIAYCIVETYLAGRAPEATAVQRLCARLPIYALVFTSAFFLPWLKAVHGTSPTYATIEFIGKDRETFCALAAAGEAAPPGPGCAVFELIEQGRDRVLLRKPPDAKVYVVPVKSIHTFAVLPPKEHP